MWILVKVINPGGIETACAAFDAMNHIAFLQTMIELTILYTVQLLNSDLIVAMLHTLTILSASQK